MREFARDKPSRAQRKPKVKREPYRTAEAMLKIAAESNSSVRITCSGTDSEDLEVELSSADAAAIRHQDREKRVASAESSIHGIGIQELAAQLQRVEATDTSNRELVVLAENNYNLTYPSTDNEEKADWYAAEAILALRVLDGRMDLASLVAEDYKYLEDIWLKDVKQAKAYFVWLASRDGKWDPDTESYYYYACRENARTLYQGTNIKVPKGRFEGVRTYVTERYLTANGKMLRYKGYKGSDNIDGFKPATYSMIKRKAQRIYETTGSRNDRENWRNAEEYVRMYYDTIILAVIDDSSASVAEVLRAFQLSKTSSRHGFWIINAFEAVVACYFVKPQLVLEFSKTGSISLESLI